MTIVHLITHPEVVVDPAVPVPDWPLSPFGARRILLAAGRPWLAGVRSVFSGAEREARDAAGLLAGRPGLGFHVVEGLGENDRSATGYLPEREFGATADAFLARPPGSVRGWERAADARRRIVRTVGHAPSLAPAVGAAAIGPHGGVGALLLCHPRGVPISRAQDQPGAGGGNAFSFEAAGGRLVTGRRRASRNERHPRSAGAPAAFPGEARRPGAATVRTRSGSRAARAAGTGPARHSDALRAILADDPLR